MPAQMEAALRHSAAKKGLTGRAADRYVYGTMNKEGVMHGNKVTAKGRAAEKGEAQKRALREMAKG